MTPTTEQVAAWARELGAESLVCGIVEGPHIGAIREDWLLRFAAIVDAHRAEQDAKLCDAQHVLSQPRDCAAAIRATIKK